MSEAIGASSDSTGSERHLWRKPGPWRVAYAVPWFAFAGLYLLTFGEVMTPQDFVQAVPLVVVPALFPALGFLLIRSKGWLWVVALLGLPIAGYLFLVVSLVDFSVSGGPPSKVSEVGMYGLFIALLVALLASLIAIPVLLYLIVRNAFLAQLSRRSVVEATLGDTAAELDRPLATRPTQRPPEGPMRSLRDLPWDSSLTLSRTRAFMHKPTTAWGWLALHFLLPGDNELRFGADLVARLDFFGFGEASALTADGGWQFAWRRERSVEITRYDAGTDEAQFSIDLVAAIIPSGSSGVLRTRAGEYLWYGYWYKTDAPETSKRCVTFSRQEVTIWVPPQELRDLPLLLCLGMFLHEYPRQPGFVGT